MKLQTLLLLSLISINSSAQKGYKSIGFEPSVNMTVNDHHLSLRSKVGICYDQNFTRRLGISAGISYGTFGSRFERFKYFTSPDLPDVRTVIVELDLSSAVSISGSMCINMDYDDNIKWKQYWFIGSTYSKTYGGRSKFLCKTGLLPWQKTVGDWTSSMEEIISLDLGIESRRRLNERYILTIKGMANIPYTVNDLGSYYAEGPSHFYVAFKLSRYFLKNNSD